MLISGAARSMDWSEVDARVMQTPEKWPSGNGGIWSLTMAQRSAPRGAALLATTSRDCWTDQPGIVGNVVRSLVRGDRVSGYGDVVIRHWWASIRLLCCG